ncbi:MAG TPA: hypothetical protein VEM14_02945 [Gemmatimonadaceae bacterium]|nr:hypothetical protein [Gemmatimonadaceae bacterium]
MNHLTIATSSGIVWLTLVTHFGAALIALAAGTIALVVTKGGRLHKQSGIVFTWAMITVGILASVLSAYEGKSIVGGIFVCDLVITATTTVKPLPRAGRGVGVALMILAFAMAAGMLIQGVAVWQRPHHMLAGVPAGMILFLGTVCLLAAIGDLRMIREGALRGTRRLARHLWRMCFGLFIATGSFFIGQMKFIPAPIRVVPLLFVLGVAPLPILLYWMWRVRLRRRVSGLIVAREMAAVG